MSDVGLGASEEIVQTDHFITVLKQALTQMRTQKSSAAGD
jgi:hypothetical protein